MAIDFPPRSSATPLPAEYTADPQQMGVALEARRLVESGDRALDAAAATAYGWSAHISSDEVPRELLALNGSRP